MNKYHFLAAIGLWSVSFSLHGAVVPGHIEAWGQNSHGQATPPPGLHGVTAIAAGNQHNLALLTNGTVVAWGDNFRGESDVPSGLSNVVAIAAALHSVALKEDGTVVVWGGPTGATTLPVRLGGVIAIAAGSGANGNIYTLALRSNGAVVGWGHAADPQIAIPAGLDDVVAISAGSYHALALKADGTVVGWGQNSHGEATPPAGLTGVVGIAAGQGSSFAIKSDGTLVRWGGDFDETHVPPGTSGVVHLDTGHQHALALQADGTILAWGASESGATAIPPGLTGVQTISAGGNHSLALTAAPLILSISPSKIAAIGDTVTLSVNAAGNSLSYQWRHRDAALPSMTNAALTLSDVQVPDAGDYTVLVSNPFGTASATTTLSFPPPTISEQPQSALAYRGETVTLQVVATGLEPFTYQWHKNDAPLPDSTTPILSLTNLRLADAGSYSIAITDAAGGTIVSADAIVQVIDPTFVSAAFSPAVDASIHSGGPNPHGTSTILSGTRNNGATDRGLLRFDLSSIPANAVFESARLRLHVVMIPRSPATSTFELFRLLTPWGADATWASATAGVPWSGPGAVAGVDYAATASASQLVTVSGPYEFGPEPRLIADLREWLNDPLANQGWLLKSDAEGTPQSARHFGSSESAQPPELLIEYSLPPAPPRLTSLSVEESNFIFHIQASPGSICHIESRETIDSGPWMPVTNAPAGPATNDIVITVPLNAPHRFYRARAD